MEVININKIVTVVLSILTAISIFCMIMAIQLRQLYVNDVEDGYVLLDSVKLDDDTSLAIYECLPSDEFNKVYYDSDHNVIKTIRYERQSD